MRLKKLMSKPKTENPKIYIEFNWILKVLESCENESQILNTEKLFENFIKNWGENNLSNVKEILINEFHKNRNFINKKVNYHPKLI